MSKATPGPWALGFEGLRGGKYWCVSRSQKEDCESIDIHEDDNGEADCRLIAQAPALLAALRECADKLEKAAIAGGSDPEYAALAVQPYRDVIRAAQGE
jgi:hypothetical protein